MTSIGAEEEQQQQRRRRRPGTRAAAPAAAAGCAGPVASGRAPGSDRGLPSAHRPGHQAGEAVLVAAALRVSRFISRQPANTATIWAAAITVETALTIGRFSDCRRIEKTQTGNVCSKPPVKNEISKLLNDQAKAKIAAAASDGADLGQDDVAQHLRLGGAEVDRRLLERALEADQPGGDDRDDQREGDDEVHQRRPSCSESATRTG